MKSIVVKSLGVIILVISFFYISQNLDVSFFEKIKRLDSLKLILFIFLSTILIASCIFFESFNLRNIIYKISNVKIPLFNVYYVYSKSNISKYIPGNFSQFLVRNLLFKRFQISQKKIAYSSLLETLFTASVALFWSFIFFISGLLKPPYTFELGSLMLKNGLIIIIFLFGIIFLIIFFKKHLINFYKSFDFFKNGKIIFQSFSLSFIIFSFTNILFSISFILGFNILFDISLSLNNILYVISVVISAGLIGMVTPGLSAGIGVREGVYVMFLGPLFGNEITVIIAVIHRIICVTADIFTLAVSFFIFKYNSKIILNVNN